MKKLVISTLALSTLFVAWCTKAPTQNLDAFAKCLTEKWAMIYTSETCSHCQNQKKTFGDSWQYIKDIDCLKTPQVCSDAWIKWVPNWLINGENLMWEQSLETLAAKTGCELPSNE